MASGEALFTVTKKYPPDIGSATGWVLYATCTCLAWDVASSSREIQLIRIGDRARVNNADAPDDFIVLTVVDVQVEPVDQQILVVCEVTHNESQSVRDWVVAHPEAPTKYPPDYDHEIFNNYGWSSSVDIL